MLYLFRLLASNNKEDTKAEWAHRIATCKQSSRPIFWEVAVEALRFRRDFFSLPPARVWTEPARPEPPSLEAHTSKGSILNMPTASTIARRGPNSYRMTVANCGAFDA